MQVLLTLIVGAALAQSGSPAHTGTAALPRTDRPADTLLRSLPPDAVAVLVVERLSDHFTAWSSSGIWERARRLPTIQAWFASAEHEQLEKAVAIAESFLGLGAREALDALLGEAVVLSLHPEPKIEGGYAGLVLVHARDVGKLREIVERLETVNPGGALPWELREREQHGLGYVLRVAPGTEHAADAFALLPDGRFAWSNSESAIRSFLDRAARVDRDQPAILDWLMENRKAFPARPFLELHLSDHLWREALANSAAARSGLVLEPFREQLELAAEACVGVGVALSDERGFSIRCIERFSSGKGTGSLVEVLAGAPDLRDITEPRVGTDTIAHGGVSFDTHRLVRLLVDKAATLAPVPVGHIDLFVSGILDEPEALRSILSRVGPGARILVHATNDRRTPGLFQRGLELFLAVEIEADGRAAAQIRRLVQTLFALVALDTNHEGRKLRYEAEGDGGTLSLSLAEGSVTFRIGDHWCVIGTSEAATRSWSELLNRPSAEQPAGAEPGVKAYLEIVAGPLRAWLVRDRDNWIEESSRTNGIGPDQAAREFDQAVDVLSLVDRVRLVVSVLQEGRLFAQELTILPSEPR